MSEISFPVFKLSIENLLHMILLKVDVHGLFIVRSSPGVPELCPFTKIYIHIEKVCVSN